jgi:hypothetical protein
MEGKGADAFSQDGQVSKPGMPAAQVMKKATSAADDKKKWMRRI